MIELLSGGCSGRDALVGSENFIGGCQSNGRSTRLTGAGPASTIGSSYSIPDGTAHRVDDNLETACTSDLQKPGLIAEASRRL